jgi:thymidylate synthase (FAD)
MEQEMKVTLLDFTGKGQDDPARYAAALLAYTKATRLQMTAGLFEEFQKKSYAQLLDELAYMANTIPSSWEMVDYTFQIEGVSRAFTHQFVRTRTASYAQQTMRVLNVSEGKGWEYLMGPSFQNNWPAIDEYTDTMELIGDRYKSMIAKGVKVEDARGILPTNILTNITVKMNMRTFVEMARKRASIRTQGEYRDVLDAMRQAVLDVHPWIDLFFNRTADKAIAELERMINVEVSDHIGPNLVKELRIKMIKQLDILREQL